MDNTKARDRIVKIPPDRCAYFMNRLQSSEAAREELMRHLQTLIAHESEEHRKV